MQEPNDPRRTASEHDAPQGSAARSCWDDQHAFNGEQSVDERRIGELRKMRDRLPMLVSTHLSAINHRTLHPSVGDVVMQQGTLAERVLVVQSGELSVERTEAGGKPRLLATVGPGEMAGEMALMGDQTHSATVTVSRGPAELLEVKADDLLQAAVYDSDLVIELLALSSHRCRETSRHLALILESLDALSNSDHSTLKQCCEELEKDDGQCLSNSADQLKQLAAKIQLTQPETRG